SYIRTVFKDVEFAFIMAKKAFLVKGGNCGFLLFCGVLGCILLCRDCNGENYQDELQETEHVGFGV
ncbi:MAG: hypothetical protein ACKOI1_07930, partial [Bacteroidota bacterium]